jgi:hypothetical protein
MDTFDFDDDRRFTDNGRQLRELTNEAPSRPQCERKNFASIVNASGSAAQRCVEGKVSNAQRAAGDTCGP